MYTKKALNYSPVTDIVYWVDGRGQKTNVTSQFYSMIATMAVNNATREGGGFTFKTMGGKLITVTQETIKKEEKKKDIGGDIFTIDEFIKLVDEACFRPYDGSGYYGNENECSGAYINWDDIMGDAYKLKATHVWWFNK